MKNVALGQYYPARSPLHKLDPRIKLLLAVLYIVTAFLCKNLLGFGLLVASALFLIVLSRVPLKTVFKSLRKFITLQLTMNFCAVGVSMIGPFIGYDSPVTVTQMLWINLIMDTLGGLAFAGEAPMARTMREAPKKRDEPILNGYMLHQIAILGGYTVSLCVAFLLHPAITGRFRAQSEDLCLLSAFFALFIFTSVLNCFSARTDRLRLFSGLSENGGFLFIMIAVSFVQLLFVYLGGSVLRTVPLLREELLFTALLSLSVIPADLIRKLLWRIGGKKQGF